MDTENIADASDIRVKDASGDSDEKGNGTTTEEETVEQKEKRLAELLAAGRRALKVNDIDKASDSLSEATELSSEIYGENHENTFDSLYYYGMATLELAKEESQLLKGPGEKESGDEEQAGNSDDKTDEENGETEKEDGEESGEEEDDDDDTMKLSWEILETARCIAAAKIEALEAEQSGISAIEEWNLKLADVLVLLGEHGISDGKYTQAFEDLDRALNIQRNVLPPSSRKIAQTYILIGNACASDANYDETVQYFGKTKDVLIARQTELKHELERGVDDKEKKSEFENELKELEEMMPGVEEMIADAVHSAAQVEETKKAIKAQFEGFTQVLAKLPQEAGDQKEANDISSLVRRPAKRAVDAPTDNQAVKKEKEEEGTTSI
ncbi:Protein NASP homolog 1 [Caenorhabditis elegans]|uniref:Protein NASP homolog 1 n=1 Tax=Caenorhabditis elegans TaxID=6239 RepID=NASP1_CAEEL|nr:Protein NASP homolog 1 [Caenorhabditis elegans]Q17886.1 RecName: Full=Protein NASP homolog 1 [Caenorhabditis elegans]CAA90441.1 Protein NASP homolog 1 [Caenorhabditis elegans]|eukprot:NP_496380.1 NASP (human Nuclear Autoantigenic Sperm Protein) homolog [Caenorhabditis elegans]